MSMTWTYHRSTWPLHVPPYCSEVVAYLDRDYGTTPTSTDEEFVAAMRAAGHDPEASHYDETVIELHRLRRYEAQTGHPF